jgi:hypothetical protein
MMNKLDQKTVDSILRKIYSNLSSRRAYLGHDKLYRVLKCRSITNIGKHTAIKWLQNQDDYSLQKQVRHTFKRTRVVVWRYRRLI